MAWVEVFAVFVICHLVGDYLLQTEWQATNKRGGLGPDPTARRALLAHVSTYTLAFVPALIWLAGDIGAWVLGVAVLIFVPHFIQDDGRALRAYIMRFKGAGAYANTGVVLAVDQTFHLVTLFGIALLVAA